MPLYEYSCHRCGKHFDVLQKFADEPLTTHPDCGGEVERLISAPAFKFKGSGWYVNDYGRGKTSLPDSANGHGNGHGDKNGSKPESKPETKSDTKPAIQPESKPAPVASADK
jgi:putative FmdB family regulatory protein